MAPFPLKVLAVTRTICEKVMSLVRFSYEEKPVDMLKNKVRHAYDIHQLLKDDKVSEFFNSKDFEEMLIKVAQDDVESYKNKNDWLANHPNQSKIFAELEEVWSKLEDAYNQEFGKLVFGNLPKSENIRSSLERVRSRMEQIKWTVEV